MSHADEMGLTPEAAQGYEEFFVPAIFDQWPAKLLTAVGLTTADDLLEVGCGTGILARQAVEWVGPNGSVTGLDLSASMLEVARRISPDLTFHQGNVMDLPFADESFDCVAAAFVLMFVSDQAKALQEMWRVLRPGGRLVLSVWESLAKSPAYADLVDITRTRIGVSAAGSLAWPFTLGDNGNLAAVFDAAEIATISIEAHDGRATFPSIEAFVRTEFESWLLAESVTEAALDAVLADANERLSSYANDNGAIDIPFNALLAVAAKT